MDPALIALVGTVFGGAGFKIIEYMLGKTKVKDDTAMNLRTELRTDLSANRAELQKLRDDLDEQRDEVDVWRARYYELVSAVVSKDEDRITRVIRGKDE